MILILSDNVFYREALKSLVCNEIEEANIETLPTRSLSLLKQIAQLNPEVLLIETNVMERESWNLLKNIKLTCPECRVVLLANSNEQVYLSTASRNGATAYVLNSSPKEILIGALKIVLGGGVFFDSGLSGYTSTKDNIKQKHGLSSREMEIVTLIKDGLSSKEIASHLGISFHTVETNRKTIYNKLNVRKVTELIKLFSN